MNGDNTNEVFKFLKNEARGIFSRQAIAWNFVSLSGSRNIFYRAVLPRRTIELAACVCALTMFSFADGSGCCVTQTKFIVDREGNVVHRYAPITKPEAIASDIEKYVSTCQQLSAPRKHRYNLLLFAGSCIVLTVCDRGALAGCWLVDPCPILLKSSKKARSCK